VAPEADMAQLASAAPSAGLIFLALFVFWLFHAEKLGKQAHVPIG
jgi:hypothetical protein